MTRLQQRHQRVPEHTKRFLHTSDDIAQAIEDELERRVVNTSAFASEIGVSEERATLMLTGMYNFSIKELARIQIALEIQVLPVFEQKKSA